MIYWIYFIVIFKNKWRCEYNYISSCDSLHLMKRLCSVCSSEAPSAGGGWSDSQTLKDQRVWRCFCRSIIANTNIEMISPALLTRSGALRCSALLDQSDAQSIKLQSPRIPCGSIRTSAPGSCRRPPPSKTAAASDRCRSQSLYRPSTGQTSQK